ncbi:PAS-domain containing phosphoglycerate kinase,putative [Leishmania mexicana MHOM/GT/2001/U1103]|uniref:Phosphoglycerate kinase n=1 Tax=Leishmania mexicana (strain MHOM/GT/2001/U1103) TaxID=929439 RepID=E9B1B3_LEIMU|nr:PAS-domain containing phosphoglycerate kinase,putative [Leishmania mexicana MHOM/GT/2001/U1103]CBZ29019.1 PAS-domain containing phosphoglycerate kinase,putative [Leishmania mexicana MHOM/GT/2001/U1103]
MYQDSKILMIFKSLRDIVVIGDNDMVITDMNAAAVAFFGWKIDDVKGKSITFLVPTHPLDVQDNTVTLMAHLANSTDVPVVIQTTRDPHATVVAWTILPIRLPRVYEFGVHINIRAALTPKLSVSDLDFKNRTVFLRVDFNVPFDRETGNIRDDSRICAAVPTIRKIMEDGGRLVIGSHLGRPKKPNANQSLKRILPRLQEVLDKEVSFCTDAFEAGKDVKEMKNGDVMLLENLRFFKGEDSKDAAERNKLASALASFSDIFVCDAFGTVHRMTASMTGVPRVLGAGVTGFLIEKEISAISMVMRNPEQPLVAVVGGSKVSDKINVLSSIFNFAHTVIIGGAMAYTFLETQGYSVGKSKVERVVREKGRDVDLHNTARDLMDLAKARKVRLILPIDHSCAKEFKDVEPFITNNADIPAEYMGLDYGPKSIEQAKKAVAEARTLIWNGPLGVFEFSHFATGTNAIAQAIKDNQQVVSIVGGGETAAATKDYHECITHVSTGGGAFLELLEGRALPGLICLTARASPKL